MKRLFKVKVSIDLMVAAEDSSEVSEIARPNALREIEEYGHVDIQPITNLKELSSEWENLIPYSRGAEETRTCRHVLESVLNKKEEPISNSKLSLKQKKEAKEVTTQTTTEAITTTTTTIAQKVNTANLPHLKFRI